MLSIVQLKSPSIILFPFSIKFCSLSKKRFLGRCFLVPWRDINTENSVIRGSPLKEHKSLFWISVNLSDIFKTQMKLDRQSCCVTTLEEEKMNPNQLLLLWYICSWMIWVLVKTLVSFYVCFFLQNSRARSCFKGSAIPPVTIKKSERNKIP